MGHRNGPSQIRTKHQVRKKEKLGVAALASLINTHRYTACIIDRRISA